MTVDDDLDQMIREAQHRHADQITSSRDPVPEIFARVQRTRRRRRVFTTLAAAVVTAAGIGAVVRGAGLLPDGDTTGRTSASSPTPSSSTTAPIAPRTLEDALRAQLQGNPAVRVQLVAAASPRGAVLCSTHVFGADGSHEHLYAWVACGTYSTGPLARLLTSGGDPAVLTVKGSGAETKVVAVRFPRIAHYDADIAAMFPAPIVAEIGRREFQTVPTGSQLLAEARHLGTN